MPRGPPHPAACDRLRRPHGTRCPPVAGPLVDAVLASAAIPGVFPPVEWEGRLLVDGALANSAPITHALDLGALHVYVLPTGCPCELTSAPRGAVDMLVYARSRLLARSFTRETRGLTDTRVTILPAPNPIRVQPMDFGHAEELMARAEGAARDFLAACDAPCSGTPTPTAAHSALEHGLRSSDAVAIESRVRTGVARQVPADVLKWRREVLRHAGFDDELATELARNGYVDLHDLLKLVDQGCAPHLAARILTPP